MKKLLITIFLFLIPTTAHAYVDYYYHYLLFSYGLHPLSIERPTTSCDGTCQYFIIRGSGAEKIKLDNNSGRVAFIHTQKDNSPYRINPLKKDEVSLQFKNVGWFDYEFWKVNGSIEDRPFTLVGLSMEGDPLANHMTLHIVLFIIVILFVRFGIKKWQRKKRA